MLMVIENLRAVAQCFREGAAVPADLAAWLERSLRQFLDHRCASIDEALGLRFPRGGVPWWLEEAMRIRDEALRELVRRFGGGMDGAPAASIHTLSERYAAINWIADRERPAMPQRYRDTPAELLWRAFKSGAPMPLSERRLRSILVGAREYPRPAAGAPLAACAPLVPGFDGPAPDAA